MSGQVETDDAVVLLLGAPSERRSLENRIEGITRLEKMVFLLEHESDLAELLAEQAEFKSHNFGPFSSKVYQAVDILAAAGILSDSMKSSDSADDSWEKQEVIGFDQDPYSTRDFDLTDRGKRYYRALIDELPEGTESELAKLKGRFGSLPLRQLIRYVYQKYPQFTDKSRIRDEVMGS